MIEDENKSHKENHPNPDKLDSVSITPVSHEYGVFDKKIEVLSKLIKRKKSFIDEDGFQVEIIAAANNDGNWAWMESKSKETHGMVDISFIEYLYRNDEIVHSWEIESYNPYFGCDVSYMEWWGDYLVTIYEEKHDTYISSINLNGENSYLIIEHEWCMNDNRVFFRGYKEPKVNVVKLPSLKLLPSLTLEEAKKRGLLPKSIYNKSIDSIS